eukprot:10213268-Karenia_brevis.AAC.1
MHEKIREVEKQTWKPEQPVPRHVMRLAGGTDKDPRTYNLPASAEISCVVVGQGPFPSNFISVYERKDEDARGSTHEISYLSEHVDPLTYPLLHVDGTLGYSTALQTTVPDGIDQHPKTRNISMT